ncbi:MAG TPA: 2-oxoacid:acceptor oxidoreductase family protein [Candidatus Eremiobacteraeota bacterium]|nr:MAG: indolepyruvate oxidoreductase subunit beta [bacterium ADurb.Bin363]HPZ07973.1 2-oxoacid:acceptor oxidoreductase family protein [Candidatus Eremiobacteraeota bacterium]
MNNNFNIYVTGVGGQGTGLLSELIIRACDYGGYFVRGVDTHGLAQRGGTVISHIRIGDGIYSPLIKELCADLLVALEVNEAMRALNTYLKDGGTLVYYNVLLQPLSTRLGKDKKILPEKLSEECKRRGIREIKVFCENLKEPRIQNVIVLAEMAKRDLIPDVKTSHYERALKDLLHGKMLEMNLEIFTSMAGVERRQSDMKIC